MSMTPTGLGRISGPALVVRGRRAVQRHRGTRDVTGGTTLKDILFYLVAGIGIGSLFAMLGASLVVVYKGSGVINFAMGAMGMYGMATFDRAWNRGELFLPVG